MAIEIDHRFSKQQVFELYANEVYLAIAAALRFSFGEAAVYFSRRCARFEPRAVAFLGGIIRAPNHYATAETHMDRAIEARDRVLTQMVENNYATDEQVAAAKKVPFKFITGGIDSGSSPYFVDMVKDHLLEVLEMIYRARATASIRPSIPVCKAAHSCGSQRNGAG